MGITQYNRLNDTNDNLGYTLAQNQTVTAYAGQENITFGSTMTFPHSAGRGHLNSYAAWC